MHRGNTCFPSSADRRPQAKAPKRIRSEGFRRGCRSANPPKGPSHELGDSSLVRGSQARWANTALVAWIGGNNGAAEIPQGAYDLRGQQSLPLNAGVRLMLARRATAGGRGGECPQGSIPENPDAAPPPEEAMSSGLRGPLQPAREGGRTAGRSVVVPECRTVKMLTCHSLRQELDRGDVSR